jgi:aspartate carbamoyltransferase
MKGLVLASLFYEPSTRTRFSFEIAMKRLGGMVVTAVSEDTSSLSKGETFYDTGKMMDGYADIVVMRHSRIGSVAELARGCGVPVINAGDGPGQHPTQALVDAYTILKEKGRLGGDEGLDGLILCLAGDLKYGRTVHSLLMLLRHFDVKLVFASPEELRLPEEYKQFLREKNVEFREVATLEEGLAGGGFGRCADVVYMTRVQQERFENRAEYERLRLAFVLDRATIERCGGVAGSGDLTVMHPLPRVGEISMDVDGLSGAAYLRQAANGVPMRMALLALVAGKVS